MRYLQIIDRHREDRHTKQVYIFSINQDELHFLVSREKLFTKVKLFTLRFSNFLKCAIYLFIVSTTLHSPTTNI